MDTVQALKKQLNREKENTEAREVIGTLEYFKCRILSLACIMKDELEAVESLSEDIIAFWYINNALEFEANKLTLDFETCRKNFKFFLGLFVKVKEDFYSEIQSINSIEKLYDTLNEYIMHIQYFLDTRISSDKKLLKSANNDMRNLDAILKNAPMYSYCRRMIEFYSQMRTLILPAIDHKQVSLWVSTEILVKFPDEQNPSVKDVIWKVKLSQPASVLMMEFNAFSAHIQQAKRENSIFSAVVENARQKMEALQNRFLTFNAERTKLVNSGNFIPREDTRQAYYTIIDFTDSLGEIRKEFALESKILQEKLKLEQEKKTHFEAAQKRLEKQQLEIEKRKLELENLKKLEDKKAEEALRAFELEQRKNHETYKAQVLAARKEKEGLKLKLIEQIKTGPNLTDAIAKQLLSKLKKCESEDLVVIQGILNHTVLEEKPVHKALLALGFEAERISSQGYNYQLGPFSAAFHPAHTASATAGTLNRDFLSKLRRIFWAVGFDKELIDSFQKRLSFKAQKTAAAADNTTKTSGKKLLPMYESKAAASNKKAATKPVNTASSISTSSAAKPPTAASSTANPNDNSKKKKRKKKKK